MAETDVVVALCTCPDEIVAGAIADALVGGRLAACVNLIGGLRSTYRWKGEVCCDPEVLLVIKTTTANLDAVTARVRELHRYELPELIALPVVGGFENYLNWVRESVKS
ncbi:MAG: divalent-cation tolerance protein CutA [Chromatiales bacterium]|nr:divalent-cation tolerance protein CutA [Chromatiales bacterium]